MKAGPVIDTAPPEISGGKRYVLRDNPGEPRLLALDAAPMLTAEDAGAIAVTGSHAALFRGRPDNVIGPDLYAVFFNDAGVGLDGAGITRLPTLTHAPSSPAPLRPTARRSAMRARDTRRASSRTSTARPSAPAARSACPSSCSSTTFWRRRAGLDEAMTLARAQSIDDLRRLAKRRLPKILFELIESGVESEEALARNRAAFGNFTFHARYLGEIAERNQAVTVFGRRYASPFGIGPTGFAGLMRNGVDEALAAAAAGADIPFILSGASIASIEAVSRIAPRHTWAHLYPAKQPQITTQILDRYARAGVETLVVTVDNPVFPKRERDNRNGFTLPLRMPASILLETLLHPPG